MTPGCTRCGLAGLTIKIGVRKLERLLRLVTEHAARGLLLLAGNPTGVAEGVAAQRIAAELMAASARIATKTESMT